MPLDYDLLRELVAQGLNNCEIARRLGCGNSAVGKAAERLGLRQRKSRGDVDVEKLFRLWGSDMLREDIARELGVSVSHLAVLCRRHHLPKRKPQRNQADTDPTPEEIAQGCAEARAKRVIPDQGSSTPGIRTYSYSSRTGLFTPSRIA